jgi:hypothetical protein
MVNVFHRHLTKLNRNRYFLVLMILILNVCSRYLRINFGYTMQTFLSSEMMKIITIFTFVWMATRDIELALFVSFIFMIIVEHLLHEESNFCIIPLKYRTYKPNEKDQNNSIYDITELEIDKAIQVLMKAKNNTDCVKRIEHYNF